ncbi:hypothetical protein pb186bvf_014063 [Paramecium bursaria]
MLFVTYLFTLVSSSLVGKQTASQFLPDLYEWLRDGEIFIDQSTAFHSIDSISQLFRKEQQDFMEDKEVMQELDETLLSICQQKVIDSQQELQRMERFLEDQVSTTKEYLQNIIKDKEKMIEQDERELEKLKNKFTESKLEIKVRDISLLIKDIELALERERSDELYKIMEIVESKAVVGLFHDHQYEEVDYYLKQVDIIFRSKNYQEDKVEIIGLLSLILNVLQDCKMQLMYQVQEEKISEFEVLNFYETSKQTHTKAKDYFEQQLNNLQNNVINMWSQLIKDQTYIIQESKQIIEWFKEFSKENQIRLHKTELHLNEKRMIIEQIEQNFLNSK